MKLEMRETRLLSENCYTALAYTRNIGELFLNGLLNPGCAYFTVTWQKYKNMRRNNISPRKAFNACGSTGKGTTAANIDRS